MHRTDLLPAALKKCDLKIILVINEGERGDKWGSDSDKGPYRPEARVRSKLSKLNHTVFSIDQKWKFIPKKFWRPQTFIVRTRKKFLKIPSFLFNGRKKSYSFETT